MSKHTILKNIAGNLKGEIGLKYLDDPEVGSIVRHRIPTSSLALNQALGGGIPCGRLTEIFGEESSGKSSIVADIIAQTQKLGGTAIIIDSENAFDPKRAAAFGVVTEDVVYSDEMTVEGAFEIMDAAVSEITEKDPPSCIIWDSVAASPTRNELLGEIGDASMAEKARLLSKGIRRVTGKISQNVALVFANQVRTKMNVRFGKPTESSGGFAIRFAASIRLELTKMEQSKEAGLPVGIMCKAYTVKNKTFPPFKTAKFEISFQGGLDDSQQLIECLESQGIITRKAQWYIYKDEAGEEIKFMRKNFANFLEKLGDKREDIVKKALTQI